MADIELVCDDSPIASVLVEWKAHYSGKWKQQQFRTSLDQLCIQPKCTVTVEISWIFYLQSVSNLEVFPFNDVNQIGRATTGDPILLDYGRFGECMYVCMYFSAVCWNCIQTSNINHFIWQLQEPNPMSTLLTLFQTNTMKELQLLKIELEDMALFNFKNQKFCKCQKVKIKRNPKKKFFFYIF